MMDTLGAFLLIFIFAFATILICTSVARTDGVTVRVVRTVVIDPDNEYDLLVTNGQ